MSRWVSSDSGILRKNKVEDNLDSLLVFGYACKLFRDDEKALYVDQGKHLIPWMADEKLKIDRYDCRGALSDLKQYEASREGYDAMRWLGLSESERKLEELCDNERYYSLEINEEEEEMYKEEAAKRQKTNAFAYSYDLSQSTELAQKEGIPTVPEKDEDEEPYVPSPVLDVPVDINIPKTMKEYTRIEKTAVFVSRQGPQMEILIKAKQADNPQFSFLLQNDSLYKFYRHVLAAFKNGRYRAEYEKNAEEAQQLDRQEDDQNSHYLHPSLQSGSAKMDTTTGPKHTQPPIPSVPYRPTADCAYSQLVNRIQGTGLASASHAEGNHLSGANVEHAQMTLEQQYQQYYYVQQWYEYWRHSVISGENGAQYATLPTDFLQLDLNMQNYIHQMAYAQYMQQQKQQIQQHSSFVNNSYAQIVSNLNKDSVNPYTTHMPQLPPDTKTDELDPVTTQTEEERIVTLVKSEAEEVKKPLLSLAAAYGSGSESGAEGSSDEENNSEIMQEDEQIEVYRMPPSDIQIVIDKMAEYVSKNGEQFEEIIKAKGDPRFEFVNEGHEFNKYYRTRLRELQEDIEEKEEKKVEKKSKPKKVIAPVSFSIKKPKDETSKEIKSALPLEESSDEEPDCENSKSPSLTAAPKILQNSPLPHKLLVTPKIGPVFYKIGHTAMSLHSQPKAENLSPKNEQMSPKSERESLKDGPESPKKDKLSPKRERRSPNKERVSPKKEQVSLKKEKMSPKKERVSPKKEGVSPKIEPTSLKRRSESPIFATLKTSPKRRSLSPKCRSSTSKRRSASPKKRPASPRKDCKRAKSRSTSPKKLKGGTEDIFPDDVEMNGVKGKNGKKIKESDAGNKVLDSDDPILEMMGLEDNLAKDVKSVQERAARDKLAEDAKEKALQLERKRKAAAFLKLKSAETLTSISNQALVMTPDKTVNKMSKISENGSRRNSEDSEFHGSSRSNTRERSRSRAKDRGRSKERRKTDKKHKRDKEKDRSGTPRKDGKKRKKEKKKKSHKRKLSKSRSRDSKSKKKSRKQHRRSHSRSSSRPRTKSRSRSISKSSHSSVKSS